MKIDLHVHTSERSRCARNTEEEMARGAIANGLDAMVITDHQKHLPEARAAELNAQFAPLRIFSGIEVAVVEGEEFVVLGVHEAALEAEVIPAERLFEIARGQGGFIILAHPYRYRETVDVDLESLRPDAIELHSISIAGSDEERIAALIRRAGARAVTDSDAHRAEYVGLFHNVVRGEPADERELIALLKAGAYECRRNDELVTRRNREVEPEEARMRDYIARGCDGRRFRDETGGSIEHFAKVRRGGSYRL
jgi:hypothetical protein